MQESSIAKLLFLRRLWPSLRINGEKMAKLYFKYGTVGSAKTLHLLTVAHNYTLQNKKAFLLKPAIDTRFGKDIIRSRAGLEKRADLVLKNGFGLLDYDFQNPDSILVDEAQFFTKEQVEDLRLVSLEKDIPIICYGLRCDFRSYLFEGSKRLMELADSVEEIKSTCFYCHKKASCNLKYLNGKAVADGPSIELGADEKYHPACYSCYRKQIQEAKIKMPEMMETK